MRQAKPPVAGIKPPGEAKAGTSVSLNDGSVAVQGSPGKAATRETRCHDTAIDLLRSGQAIAGASVESAAPIA